MKPSLWYKLQHARADEQWENIKAQRKLRGIFMELHRELPFPPRSGRAI